MNEAQSRFGELVKWTTEHNDTVIVKLYGGAAVVIMPYTQYQQVKKLRQREQKRAALSALATLRREAQRQTPGLTGKQAYQLAGFAEPAVQETIQADQAAKAQ